MVNVIHKSVCNILLLILTLSVSTNTVFAGPTKTKYDNSSICFVENKGQVTDQYGNQRPDAHFRLKSGYLSVFICAGSMHYQWSIPEESNNLHSKLNGYRLDVTLQNANTGVKPEAVQETGFFETYYTGNLNGVQARAFGKIVYRNIYNNIDWVLYVQDGGLKYDFIIHPGGRASDIKIEYSGATKLSVSNGDLVAETPLGSITEKAPYSYDANSKTQITSSYELNKNILTFNIAEHSGTTIIDPSLEWATYMGGSNNDFGVSVAADTAGNVYMVGNTASGNSPNVFTSNAHQTQFGGIVDGVITKYTPAGVKTWSTFYGGGGYDVISSVAVDNQNNIIFCGITDTSSTGLNSSNTVFHPSHGGGTSDAFLGKMTPAGVRIWGTYVGGEGDEASGTNFNFQTAVSLDGDNNIYMVGTTTSDTGIANGSNVAQSTRGGKQDGYIIKFNPNGARQWGTYYGDTADDVFTAVATSPNGFVYTTGSFKSPGLGTASTHAQNKPGASGDLDVLVGKFNPNTGARIWTTYFGGSLTDEARGIAVSDTNFVYFSGLTNSTTGIVSNDAEQLNHGGYADAFLAKFDSTGLRKWATYLGGSGTDNGGGLMIDHSGNVNLSGNTASSTDIATNDGYRTSLGSSAIFDAFLAIYTPTGKKTWATYYGGTDNDYGFGVAKGKAEGHVYLCGNTASSSDIAYSGSQMSNGGLNDAFLVKFTPDTSVSILQPFTQTLHCSEDSFTINYIVTEPFRTGNVFTIQLSNATGSFANPTNIGTVTGTTAGNVKVGIPSNLDGTGFRIRITATLPIDTSYDNGNDITIKPMPIWPVASNNGPTCSNDTLRLYSTNSSPNTAYSWTGPDNYATTVQNSTRVVMTASLHSGDYIVTANLNGCIRKDTTTVTILQAATKPNLTSNGPLCEGDNLQLNATPATAGSTIEWSGPLSWGPTGGMSQTINNVTTANAGKYIINLKINGCQSKDTVDVIISAKPAPVVASATNTTICSHESLQLFANCPTPDVVYNWKGPNITINNSQNPVLKNLNPSNSGDFVVTADLFGCAVRDTIKNVVIKLSPLKPVATAPSHLCSGDDLQLSASSISGGASYGWKGPKGVVPGTGNPRLISSAQVSDAGDYILTSTNTSSGCSQSDTVTVAITQSYPLNFTAEINPGTVVCPTANLVFKVNPAPSSTLNPVYTWTGPGGFNSSSPTPTINNAVYDDSGFYIVRVVTGACSVGIDTVHLAVVDTITAPVVTLPPFDCTGDTMMVGITHPYINQFYLKYPGVSSPVGPLPAHIMTNLTKADHEGMYIVSVSAGGCTAADTAYLAQVRPTPLKPNTNSNSPLCEGGTLELKSNSNTPGVNYEWQGPGGYSSNSQNANIDNVDPTTNSGVYISKVVLDGCPSASDTETVVINNNPTPNVAPDLKYCEGGILMLDVTNANANETYAWTGGQGFNGRGASVSINPATLADAGQYIVTATSGTTGCKGTATTDVYITPLPGKPDATYKEPLCSGDKLELSLTDTSTGNILYAWTGPNAFTFLQKEAFIEPVDSSHSGMYIVRANRDGCTIDDTVMVRVRPRPAKPDIVTNSPLVSGETLELSITNPTPGASFKWSGPLNFGSFVQNPQILQVNNTASGTYSVVTTLDGCSSSSFVIIMVSKGDGSIDQLVLYPNPNKGNFAVKAKLSYDQIMPYEVLNTLGMVVYSGVAQSRDKQMEERIEIDGVLASGVYIFRMMVSGQSKEIPFTIVR